jgi:hypothetical protein
MAAMVRVTVADQTRREKRNSAQPGRGSTEVERKAHADWTRTCTSRARVEWSRQAVLESGAKRQLGELVQRASGGELRKSCSTAWI